MAQGLTTKVALDARPSHFTTPGLSAHPAGLTALHSFNRNQRKSGIALGIYDTIA